MSFGCLLSAALTAARLHGHKGHSGIPGTRHLEGHGILGLLFSHKGAKCLHPLSLGPCFPERLLGGPCDCPLCSMLKDAGMEEEKPTALTRKESLTRPLPCSLFSPLHVEAETGPGVLGEKREFLRGACPFSPGSAVLHPRHSCVNETMSCTELGSKYLMFSSRNESVSSPTLSHYCHLH